MSADGNDMTTSPTQPMPPAPSIKAPITSTTTTSPSAATIKTTIAKVKNLKARSRAKKKAVITWKKMSGVTGYQMQYSLKKNFQKQKNYNN